jgi:septum formation protein
MKKLWLATSNLPKELFKNSLGKKRATIGSDQIFLCRGKVFGKPHTSEKAIKQLMLASGQWCELHTAVCVITPKGEEVSFINVTRLKFRKLTREEARHYVSLDAPESCAGSFKFESLGITLFDEVETSDPSAIEGLPLIQLANTLRQI